MRTTPLLGAAMLATLCSTSALAVVGGEADRLAPNQREHRIASDAIQERLAQQPAWQGFLDRNGPEWTALFDEATRTPTRFWGAGWDVDADKLADDDGALAIAFDILANERQLLGDVALSDLAPLVVDRKQGITTVTFARTWNRLPVDGALISLRFKAGRFVMGQIESMPGIDLRVIVPSIGETAATDAALSAMGWAPGDTDAGLAPSTVVYPIASAWSVDYRLAWKLELRSTTFPSRRHVYVDAGTGEVLGWREQVRFIEGALAAEHDDRFPDNGMITSPLALAEATINGEEVEADATGGFTVGAGGSVTWTAGSRYFRVRNSGDVLAEFSGTLSADGDTLVATPGSELDEVKTRRVLAQLDTHVAAHVVRERALRIDPGFSWASTRVDATVNADDQSCNAWFDGDINFVREADGCNNTGRVADVVFHEYGHGFHAYSIINGAGGYGDGSLGEGMGDYMAATITGDPATARGFFKGSDDPLRDIEINRVWPEDVGEIHQTGRIIAGALWDARKALINVLGEEAGVAHADQLFLGIASRASDIPSAYAEAILVDDDNGDLSDGTPNQCLIDDAFGLHGLGPAADDVGLFAIDHIQLGDSAAADTALRIEASVALARPLCTTGDASEVRVLWSHGTDDFEALTMSPDDGSYAADIPGAPAGTEIRYRIEVYDVNGDLAGMTPRGSITDPWYATFSGDPLVLFEEDFEDDDGGFVHDLILGNADSEGADDWQWGEPGGQSGDPSSAWSGDRVWGNDLSPEENWNGAYQPNVHNVLASPVIDVSGDYEAIHLQFRRWLTVEDGFWDSAVVSVNGAAVWSQLAGESEDDASNHHEDEHWAFRSYDITSLVNSGGTAQVTWELIADGGLQLGGWNLDDVRIVAIPSLDGAELPIEGEGCACASSGSQVPGAGALLAALFLVGGLRRRREGLSRR